MMTNKSDNLKKTAHDSIAAITDNLIALSHKIHANPELAFQEEKASKWLEDFLEEQGFTVERQACDLPTAFIAKIGTGSLHIAICAEYDALPEIGHACGHNIIGTAAVGAAISLAKIVNEIDLTISVIGTPAEESGGGKILLLERGAFDDIHAAMMIHPSPVDVIEGNLIACSDFEVRYSGKEAHAAAAPQEGINAADALTIAQVAIGLLRQHIFPADRIHGIIIKGGDAPNVIPAHTAARYIIRSKTSEGLEKLRKKIMACFEAGAIATGSTLEFVEKEKTYENVVQDPDILALYKENAESLGRVFFDIGDMKDALVGSTDMGNISHVVPSIHPIIGIDSFPAVNHQPEFAAHCITKSADKAIIDGGLAMAWTIIDIACNDKLMKRLKEKDSRV
jgi:amidohydrolase